MFQALFPYTKSPGPLLSSSLKIQETQSRFLSFIPVFLAGNNSVDETGAKVRGKETQRPCQGPHPVGAFPFGLFRLISVLGESLPPRHLCLPLPGPWRFLFWVWWGFASAIPNPLFFSLPHRFLMNSTMVSKQAQILGVLLSSLLCYL